MSVPVLDARRRRVLRLRRPALSLRIDARAAGVTAGLALLAIAAAIAGIAWGGADLPLGDVLRSLTVGADGGTDLIVRELQAPRAALALVCGAGFGIAGAIFQSVLRNPLASPDIVGTAHGASLAGVAGLLLGASYGTSMALAAGGALAATALCLAVAPRREALTLVLVGIGIAALAGAGVSFLLTVGDITATSRAVLWLVGSLNGGDWATVRATGAAVAPLAIVALLLARRIDALALGDELAHGLGLRPARERAVLLVVAAALVGACVAACGPLGFAAFLAPQIGRRLAGAGSTAALPASAAAGAALVALADLLGRRIGAPGELPVGVVTALLGGLLFLVLLTREQRRRVSAGR
ncbi:iron ABC transporter permease [Patulibacter brassicae]|uniref:Iron ABC transporter permease n=1 Tax=Patulibacter brassicae TaxID=1705717 RepID=A0ABU4VH76_9ACTN|nr:iron ABC transporter permease [Patulibacter brassicae]MDX8150737.1 iron ABC transporter permease [Patulibacter brassicae]